MAWKLLRPVAYVGLILSTVLVPGALALSGCGGSQQGGGSTEYARSGEPAIPEPAAAQLDECQRRASARLRPAEYAISVNVYVTSEGRAASAYVTASTLRDRDVEACFVRALRSMSWAGGDATVRAPQQGPRGLVGMQLPEVAPVEPGPTSGIRPVRPPAPPAPEVPPSTLRWRLPLISPAFAGGIVFITISLWPRETAPRWLDETSPITGEPYASPEEYEETHHLPPQEIQRRKEQIKNAKPDAPPAPTGQAPPPAPAPDPKCQKLVEDINTVIYAVRPPTPPGGFPQGYQGLAMRWREFAENKGNWERKPDGSLGKKPDNHLKEYQKHQERLQKKLQEWGDKGCKGKNPPLPRLAEEYAAQEPELGPGKPLEPKPLPSSPKPASPAGAAPGQAKRSE